MSRLTYSFPSVDVARVISGPQNAHLALIADELNIVVSHRGGEVLMEGAKPALHKAMEIFSILEQRARRGERIGQDDVSAMFGPRRRAGEQPGPVVPLGKTIRAKTPMQEAYLNAIAAHDVVLGVGPAGTGKTYLAVASAARALAERSVRRIILCRPAVEAGEKLGFLPGDMAEKIDPYLRPLHDAMHEFFHKEAVREFMASGIVEVAPLAFMRGRTLTSAFVLLDEAQNATVEQLKMFLTRLGNGSKMVVNGDPTQVDLPKTVQSGLVHACARLGQVKGVSIVTFTRADIVRHPLVERIVEAYEIGAN